MIQLIERLKKEHGVLATTHINIFYKVHSDSEDEVLKRLFEGDQADIKAALGGFACLPQPQEESMRVIDSIVVHEEEAFLVSYNTFVLLESKLYTCFSLGS